MSIALDAGAEDIVNNEDGSIDVITAPEDFIKVKSALEESELSLESAAITMRATTTSRLDMDNAKAMMNLLDTLEDLDDVQHVYSNADIPENILAQLG
jgi:transcriptional/translational regulatory protein YebC/TACO1